MRPAEESSMSKQQRPKVMPSHIRPMLALLSKMPLDAAEYAFEYKWDGIRALCYWDGKGIKLESRNLLDITHRWPELTKLGDVLGSTAAILDGEIVALDSSGKVSFSLLSSRMHLSSKPTAAQRRAVQIAYMIFDVLYLKDRTLMTLSYRERRTILEKMRLSGDNWQTPPAHTKKAKDMLEAAVQNKLEGIVAKRLNSKYLPGSRTRAWLKIKPVNSQEVVIGGWVPLKGDVKRGVGALLVGYHDRPDHLVFAGKVGTGFTDAVRKKLTAQLHTIGSDNSPFGDTIPSKGVKFVEPKMVAEVEFREWTPDGRLRHPSFKGLREDKNPREVVREIPV